MPAFVCPKCRAEIQPDLIETTGAAVCPFCSADLSDLGLPQPEPAPASLDSESAASDDDSGADRITHTFPPLPEKSRIKIVEANDDRLVLFLSGGGKRATGLGCFALAWLGFMCVFTPPWFLRAFQGAGNNAPPDMVLIGFLGVFWSIGLVLAWFWMKMKYERTFLLLERQRLVVQKVLFNRKQLQETTLLPESRAELVESYKQNDMPVYRIEVRGQNRTAKFGTALADDEKNWIVDRINAFLDVVTVPAAAAPAEEVVMPAKVLPAPHYDPLDPADIPPDGPIRVDENSSDALELSFAVMADSPLRWIIPLITVPFSMAWYSAIFAFIAGAWQIPFLPARILFLAFSIPFLVAGLLPVGLRLIAVHGRTSIRLTPESLACRAHAGWFKFSQSIATQDIETVGIESLTNTAQNPRVQGSQKASPVGSQNCCVARAGGKRLHLAIFQEEGLARQVASLVRTRLEKMGHHLRDA